MAVSQFMASQYAKPTGWFGRHLMGFILKRSNTAANNLVYQSLALQPDEKVLEVGFGGGELLLQISNLLVRGHIDGVEISDVMIENLQTRVNRENLHNITLHRADIHLLPIMDAEIDCACSVNTIYFWENIEDGLKELARVIRIGGRLVLGFGSVEYLRSAGYEEKGFNLRSIEQIQQALTNTGFVFNKISKIERKGPGPFYALAAERVK